MYNFKYFKVKKEFGLEKKKKMGKDKEETESKFGFKNKEKAEETVKLLAEHDLQYQKLTVRGLLGRAKRVLTSK